MDEVRNVNRVMFLVSVLITGAVAGAFVWFLLFLMNLGITTLWNIVPNFFGTFYPLFMCIIGGIIIGLFTKKFGPYPDDLQTVMASVKTNGRYDYKDLGPMSVGALLPMIFGGSIGPEAGLTGAIAAICTWVSDRLKRFGSDFKELSEIGVYAALSAIFTAPLYGFAGAMSGERVEGKEFQLPKVYKIIVYIFAIVGAFLMFILLSKIFGGGLSLPRYYGVVYGIEELIWLIPMILIAGIGGWLFCVLDFSFSRVSIYFKEKPVMKAIIGGILLGVCGILLPYTMFAGETQSELLNESWATMTTFVLFATGFVKILVTSFCVNMGWRGGHFFPVIFSGISIGYGFALLLGINPVFAVCASTAAVVGGVMRKPIVATLLLILCFPIDCIPLLLVATVIASYIPLPKKIKEHMIPKSKQESAL